jgi:urea transport system substrate-binding protein
MQKLTDTKTKVFAAVSVTVALLLVALVYGKQARANPAVKIGVLHSLSGTMATSEAPLVDAVRLAVEEANQSGGVNGRQIEMIVSDCRSDAAYCAAQAEMLITRDGVQALFGCWTSDCRKAVKTVVEKHNNLLFYPLQYEGLEQSPNILYTGAAPNQQVIPMALWALRQHGRRYYLIGSDYVFPRTANLMVKDVLLANGGQLLGERYVPFGASDMTAAIREIAAKRPDFIVNTLNGDSNLHFFRALREAGLDAAKVPVFSTSVAEAELAAMGPDLMAGHYAAWTYFQSVDSDENRAFVAQFKRRFGEGRVLDDPMEASYIGVKMWVESVRNAGTTDLMLVKNNLELLSMAAPQGIVSADFDTMHLWKTVRIGRARSDGQFDIVWQSRAAIHPAPFPFYRSRAEWLAAAGDLAEGTR